MATKTKPTRSPDRGLASREKRSLALLGIPTFGLALSITVVTTYLPKLAHEFTGSTTVIGLIVGGEGLLALWVPLVAGSWSDRLRTRFGGRLPFVMGGVPVMALALLAMPLAGTLTWVALAVLVFFFAYFVAYEPYRALYPDLVPDEIEGKAQSTQALWRGAATALALVGGGLLFAADRTLPFVSVAGVLLVVVGIFLVLVLRNGIPRQGGEPGEGIRQQARRLRSLLGDHPALRAFLFANALWELALGAIKTFVVLYITVGLGESLSATAAILGGVALVILVAAPVSGKLGDRLGRARVMRVALWVYGLGLLLPFLVTSKAALGAVLPLVAFGGGVLMTLPYALLVPMMPEDHRGALSGFYSLSRGVGTMLGPLLAGLAIQALDGPLASTKGYAALWGVAAAAILGSIPLLGKLRSEPEYR